MSAPEYLTINEFPVGTTGFYEFQLAGGYLEKDHVKLDFVTEVGARTNYPLSDAMFVTEFSLQIPVEDIPLNAVSVRIYRETPREEPLISFTNGARLNERNLDRLAAQTIFVAAEAFDAGAFAVAEDLIGQALSAIQQANEALDEAGTIVATAAASAASALASQNAASASATSASGSASTATTQASNASASAIAAAASAAAALVSQNAAAASATAASGSATTATTQATNAGNSATAAAGSATTASTAATNAGNSATAAAGSASAAATSASNAATSATNAAASATAAAGFATGLARVTGVPLTQANTNGKVLVITSGSTLTLPNNSFADGDIVGIENNQASAITINATTNSVTLRNSAAGGATGNRTLGAYGFAVLRWTGAAAAHISGPGVS